MKAVVYGALLAAGLSGHLIGQEPVPLATSGDDKVTVSGCVIKGDGGYVLSNLTDSWAASSTGSPANTVASASSVAGRTFFWLTDDDDLQKYAGQKVEVSGKLDKEIDHGKISVEREKGMVEIEFKADGERKVTVRVPDEPSTVGTSGTATDREKSHRVTIRPINVKSVKVLASTCQ